MTCDRHRVRRERWRTGPESSATEWSVVEISRALERLPSEPNCDRERLDRVREIQALFLRHFPAGGPVIR
jgi:hypothetical protein